MIQILADYIDQLDLALDQLALNNKNHDRFALILIDNIIELTLDRFAKDQFYLTEKFGYLAERVEKLKHLKNHQNEIKKAQKDYLEPKVKLAKLKGLVTEELAESIKTIHKFRNIAYHQGIKHEKLLHSLAIFHFQNACDILKKYEPSISYSYGTEDVISQRARKYLGNISFLESKENFQKAWNRLIEVSEGLSFNLIEDLSNDMKSSIETFDNAIDFIIDNGFRHENKKTKKEVIIDIQLKSFIFSKAGEDYALKNKCKEFFWTNEYKEWFKENYKPEHEKDPVTSWKKRYEDLKSETDLHKALERYSQFIEQTRSFRARVLDIAQYLDTENQNGK